jgi:hypothetical protein
MRYNNDNRVVKRESRPGELSKIEGPKRNFLGWRGLTPHSQVTGIPAKLIKPCGCSLSAISARNRFCTTPLQPSTIPGGRSSDMEISSPVYICSASSQLSRCEGSMSGLMTFGGGTVQAIC